MDEAGGRIFNRHWTWLWRDSLWAPKGKAA